MDSQNNEQAAGSARDTALLGLAMALLVGGLAAFYTVAAALNPALKALVLLGSIGAALLVTYQTAMGRSLWGYVVGSRIELRKVVWPSKQESVQATLMIAVVVLIMALLLWGLDSLLFWAVQLLTGRGA
jgi:preprotein translocase subunit SecE